MFKTQDGKLSKMIHRGLGSTLSTLRFYNSVISHLIVTMKSVYLYWHFLQNLFHDSVFPLITYHAGHCLLRYIQWTCTWLSWELAVSCHWSKRAHKCKLQETNCVYIYLKVKWLTISTDATRYIFKWRVITMHSYSDIHPTSTAPLCTSLQVKISLMEQQLCSVQEIEVFPLLGFSQSLHHKYEHKIIKMEC